MLFNWNCIVITCSNKFSVVSTEQEVQILKKKHRIDESICVLTIEDPVKNIGSGAASLNALLVATEYLSRQKNYMVVTSDVLLEARILILHNGRDYLYSGCGKAFIQLPCKYPVSTNSSSAGGLKSNLESLLLNITKLAGDFHAGVWICSTDMTIVGNPQVSMDWLSPWSVVLFCVPSDPERASCHGVVLIDKQCLVSNIYYQMPSEQITKLLCTDEVPIVSGCVCISPRVAEAMLSFHARVPLDSCTYLGLDSGSQPVQISLYFDLLYAMCSNINKEDFISGKYGRQYNLKTELANSKESCLARTLIWEELSKFRIIPKVLSGCSYIYWDSSVTAKFHVQNLLKLCSPSIVHSLTSISEYCCVQDSSKLCEAPIEKLCVRCFNLNLFNLGGLQIMQAN